MSLNNGKLKTEFIYLTYFRHFIIVSGANNTGTTAAFSSNRMGAPSPSMSASMNNNPLLMGTPSVSKFSMGGHNPEQNDNQKPDV